MKGVEGITVDDPDDLFDLCRQSLAGASDCFAAVLFSTFNETTVEYSIAMDESALAYSASNGGWGDHTPNSRMNRLIFPLQWALDSHIGNFSTAIPPSTLPWSGLFGPNANLLEFSSQSSLSGQPTNGPYWLSLVSWFVAPVFFLILIGVVYHLATFVATERQTTISELMAAQNVTATPRILSTLLTFYLIYFPGFLICSILFTQILFTRTSDILFLFITLLAGAAVVTSSHFVASFFGKAQLAGLYCSTLAIALAFVTLSAALRYTPPQTEIMALSLIFPPACFANFISDVARREFLLRAFSLSNIPPIILSDETIDIQKINGYLYIVFFVVQIVVYTAGTYAVERGLWGVARKFERIPADSDIALRCTGLSKTYHGKRRWYFPFVRKGEPVLAVANLNIEVKKGSVTFLLGPNGGGKTTTLKCVAGMISMDSGSTLALNEAGVVFGICPQTNVFWDNLTVQEHIKIWRKLKTASFEDVQVDDDDILAECDLVEKVQAPAKTLSGGQMRKLQLAIAFVGGSKVCCIDEASSGLDPLSRRNIWNIIQKGHSRRTILVTTHFLDEADILADHIAIVYKGRLVCEGPSTSLKARYGDDYIIRSENEVDSDALVWRSSSSTEATKKLLELEAVTEDTTYDVKFPTLEQVFLKVTSDSNTAIHDNGGDGIAGEEELSTVIDEKIFALENEAPPDIDLDVGHSVGLARQVAALFRKRYTLLLQKAGWISYSINLVIPIIIAAALVKFMYRFDPLQTCEVNNLLLRNASASETNFGQVNYGSNFPVFAPLDQGEAPEVYPEDMYNPQPSTIIGPESAFTGAVQDDLYLFNIPSIFIADYSDTTNASWQDSEALSTRVFVNSTDDMIIQITNYSGTGYQGFGVFAPTPETATLYYNDYDQISQYGMNMLGLTLVTNRIANATTSTGLARKVSAEIRTMRTAPSNVSFFTMPIAILICLSFIVASSIAVIYPAFEKNNRVRALQYCNGVSPFALWFGYLLFDMQLIIIQAVFVWGLLFVGPLSKLWYESNYVLGAFILFGIATYLGTYFISLFLKKAAFAIAAGIHTLLFVLYVVAYVMNQSFGNTANLHETYSSLQYGLGLSSPAANLARALFVASNSFEVLCGKYGTADVSAPFAYVRYGSVYTNLLLQILFLVICLSVHEYGSADWIRRNITHRGIPARLHYIIESDTAVASSAPAENEKALATTSTTNPEILTVSRISKFFGKLFAVENVSFDISANQTLALLGGNGAGKTTVINMIRGELKPNFGDIHLDGVSVLKQPHKARLHMGVCPQDDAIDNLTMRQTLSFYATVKGLKNVAGNVEKVLSALNIKIYESVSVKDLSGGTRRKLSVAIALLGNPRILLLDEPSTGQDAGAKRILWKALRDISRGRAILLTTHSMEEAEALATDVAIMGTRMLAKGTLGSLQDRYGGLFSVRAVRAQGVSALDVQRLVGECFGAGVSGYFDVNGQVGFGLPHEKEKLGSIMRAMEGLMGVVVEEESHESEGPRVGGSAVMKSGPRKVIEDYTVTGPTLEEVFMNVAREAGTVGGV
ncbi:P-loop containing nucleoside triphosphate hydrolase protein [Hyaloscypha variabilis F]|uniref:P-loop containing nucleoside triphosphate hydrolase protein n=1 Tax=Hyaloscypha variabilis (strain UAMH 11265 / GT02V1 / F) TaxID=1149755 RepID=A0A2J6RPD1_HYAVF|nr:P-loop containing nucleoside triphosphate hydrolase protein [Hyaloscypha variabilis F]